MHITKKDIITAAFRTWGQAFYQQTSLSLLARDLGVTKAALYRHFASKRALLDAMYEHFFDDYTAYIMPAYTKALETPDLLESQLILMRTVVEYYARNEDTFLFALFMVYHDQEAEPHMAELDRRGIDIRKIHCFQGNIETYPSVLRLIEVTLIFWVASFHKNSHIWLEIPPDEQIRRLTQWLEDKVSGGLGLSREKIDRINFEELERTVPHDLLDTMEDKGLLKAVAGAVAEAGPWNASMVMVARRSGLSKSGLYAHFKNKQDMIEQFFLTESEQIMTYTREAIGRSTVPEEQLYLAIAAIVDYFRSRPEILIALDWIRTRRIDCGKPVLSRIYRVFSDILPGSYGVREGPSGSLKEQTAQWILFLTANILMRLPRDMDVSKFSNESLRILYKFIVLGINGCKSCYK